jgi:HEPN domain-containing protein
MAAPGPGGPGGRDAPRRGGAPAAPGCLLAQQAAEKAIKAVLVAEDVDPPKLHDLRRLLRAAEAATRLVGADPDEQAAQR